MKLGDMIREYRAEHKYSLREFADICDISFAQVRLMERGLNSDGKPFIPTIATLKKLATGMGITFNELVSISDDLTDVMTPGLWPRSEDKKRSRPTTSSSSFATQ